MKSLAPQGPVAAAVDGHGARLAGPVAAHLTAEPRGPGLGLQHQLQGGLGSWNIGENIYIYTYIIYIYIYVLYNYIIIIYIYEHIGK